MVGCSTSVGLHNFPQNMKIRLLWLRVIGLGENHKLPPHAGVCKQHFARDSFANLMEIELGYARCVRLKSDAVPTLYLPGRSQKPPMLLPRPHKCEQCPQFACVQKNVKSSCHSTGQAPNRSTSGITGTLKEMAHPESLREVSRPLKRKRIESSAPEASIQLNDDTSLGNCTSAPTKATPHKDKKYIVHEDQLLGLFRSCPVCTSRCVVETKTLGTLLQVTQLCPRCEFSNKWSSQPMVNSIPSGNLQLCAAVLFTGSSFCQISKFLQAYNVQGLTEQCFHRYQDKLLIPTVSTQWKLEQDKVIREVSESGPASLCGDTWADSPGHSAKYGNYAMMDLKSNKVIDIQLIQRKVKGKNESMEKEGFMRSLSMLEEKGVKVQAIMTDRHRGLQKVLREEKKEIGHYFDPWHMGEGMGKKMDDLSKRKGTHDARLWRKSVVNHLHWSASSSSSGQEAVAKWTSVVRHIQNVHTHDNALYPRCLHEPVVDKRARQWLKQNTAAGEKLTALLFAPRFLKDVKKISPHYRASNLEAFRSLVIKFSPKSVGLPFRRMLSRLQIAALHYNENATQSRAVNANGGLRFSIVHVKHKHGDYTARAPKTKPTSLYVDKLMTRLFETVMENAVLYEYSEKVPVPSLSDLTSRRT